MHNVLLLLNVRAVMALKGITDFHWHTVSKNLSSVLIFGGVAVGTFLVVRSFTQYLLVQAHTDLAVLHGLLSFVLFSFFLSVHVVGLLVSYTTMFVAEDIPFLMALPVRPAAIFQIRMLENILASAATLSLLGLAAILGYGSVFRLDVLEYLAIMFGVFTPFVLIAGILAVLAVVGFVLLAGRIGVRGMLGVALTLYGTVSVTVFSTISPAELTRSAFSSGAGLTAVAGEVLGDQLTWLPHHWVAQFLYALVRRDPGGAFGYAGLVLGTLAVVAALAVLVGRSFYVRTWHVAAELRARRSGLSAPHRLPLLGFDVPWPLRPNLEAVLKRDLLVFLRDPVQRLHFLMMVFLGCAVVFSLRSLDVAVHRPASLVAFFVVMFISVGFLAASFTLRFVFPAVSLEGDAFWSVRTAPIRLTALYWLKFGVSLLLVLIPAELALLVSLSAFNGPAVLHTMALAAMACLSTALVSLNLGAGAYYATLKEKNPVKVASSQGASLTFLGSLVVLLVVGGILMLPAAANVGATPGIDPALSVVVALTGIVIIALLVTVLGTRLGLRSLRKDF